jgi:steroid 5-alpha reductase family enzyme
VDPVTAGSGVSILMLFAGVLGFMALVMIASWLTQKLTHNTGWVDVFWSYGMGVSGAAVALIAVNADTVNALPVSPVRRWIVAIMILLWAARLGTYVALRVARSAEDVRYRQLRSKWGGRFEVNLFGFVLVQAPAAALFAIAPYLAARPQRYELGVQDILAILIWATALGGESLADAQMKRFKANPKNQGKICDTGLWAWSRHPNYFFEWIVWLAYPVMAISTDDPVSWLSLIAPVVMFAVLRFGTGVPPLEKSMAASRGKAWDEYKAKTSTFLLLPPRKKVDAKSAQKPSPKNPSSKTGTKR